MHKVNTTTNPTVSIYQLG